MLKLEQIKKDYPRAKTRSTRSRASTCSSATATFVAVLGPFRLRQDHDAEHHRADSYHYTSVTWSSTERARRIFRTATGTATQPLPSIYCVPDL
jgi:hypothetical protein